MALLKWEARMTGVPACFTCSTLFLLIQRDPLLYHSWLPEANHWLLKLFWGVLVSKWCVLRTCRFHCVATQRRSRRKLLRQWSRKLIWWQNLTIQTSCESLEPLNRIAISSSLLSGCQVLCSCHFIDWLIDWLIFNTVVCCLTFCCCSFNN